MNAHMSPAEICAWLENHGLGRYWQVFIDQGIIREFLRISPRPS
jgi:hypothetical protein